MDNYTLMKLSEMLDEDGVYVEDYEPEDWFTDDRDEAEKFKEKYKEFYDDVKLTIKEDW